MTGHLGQCLVGGYADADRHAHPSFHLLVQVLSPCLERDMVHTFQIHEALVDAVSEIGGSLRPNNIDDTPCQFAVQFVVRRESGDAGMRKQLGQLEVGGALFHAQCLGLVGTCHHAAIIVRQHHNRLPLQVWTENPLARNVAVVTVYNAIHV